MASMKNHKTNAMRILERDKIPYAMHEYKTDDGAVDGVSVAHKTGRNPAQVFKTLVTKGAKGGVYVFCIPVQAELDLKAAAKAVGEKSIAMIAVNEITPLTGYVRGGCSPVGMKKQYTTVLDESAKQQTTILVSGGKIGLQIEITPQDLQKVTGAGLAQVT